jgi:hypothetical protein
VAEESGLIRRGLGGQVRRYEGSDEESQEVELFFEGKTDQDRYIEMVQAGLSAHEVNQNTLNIALSILERSWFWRFRSTKKKMKMVEETYAELTKLI